MSKGTSIRLDDATRDRIVAVADEYQMDFSTALRMALKRGLAAIESDNKPPAAPAARRRVLSRGVG